MIIAFFLFLKNKAFFLILSLLFFTLSKVGPKNPFATLPLPFSLILSSLFSKSNTIYLRKKVQVLIFFLYTAP